MLGGRKTGNKMTIRWFIPFEANVHRSREPPEVRTRRVANPGRLVQENRARLPWDYFFGGLTSPSDLMSPINTRP